MKTTLNEKYPDSCMDCEFFHATDSDRPWLTGKCYMFMVTLPGCQMACCSRVLGEPEELQPQLNKAVKKFYAEIYERKYHVKSSLRNVVPNLQDNLPLI